MPTPELTKVVEDYLSGKINRTNAWYNLNAISYQLSDQQFAYLMQAIANWKRIDEENNV